MPVYRRVLKRGDEGPDVRAVPQQLIALGYGKPRAVALSADGKFGSVTEAAVTAFMRSTRIVVAFL